MALDNVGSGLSGVGEDDINVGIQLDRVSSRTSGSWGGVLYDNVLKEGTLFLEFLLPKHAGEVQAPNPILLKLQPGIRNVKDPPLSIVVPVVDHPESVWGGT